MERELAVSLIMSLFVCGFAYLFWDRLVSSIWLIKPELKKAERYRLVFYIAFAIIIGMSGRFLLGTDIPTKVFVFCVGFLAVSEFLARWIIRNAKV